MAFVLAAGPSAGGKSEYAEGLVCASGCMPRIYIAAMEPFGEEAERRIARHRRLRAGKGFETLEQPVSLAEAALRIPEGAAVLVESLGVLTANEMFSPRGAGAEHAREAVLEGLLRLRERCGFLAAVTEDACSAGTDYAGETDRWLRILSEINRAAAAEADAVCEVVCGIPSYYKGTPPFSAGTGGLRSARGSYDLV